MKKFITIFCLVSSLLIILDSFNFGYALMIFFFAGIIPGTNFQLTPEQMFGLSAVAASLVMIYFKSPNYRRAGVTTSEQVQSRNRRRLQV